MDTFVTLILVALGCGLIGAAACGWIVRRGRPSAGEYETLRQHSFALERDIAVERERAARAVTLESENAAAKEMLESERAARAAVERNLAATTEARSQIEMTVADLKDRLAQGVAEAAQAAEVLKETQRHHNIASIELATLRETLDQERRQGDEKLQLIRDAKESMTKEFQVLANDVMSRHGEAFTKQNQEQLDGVLKPLREKMTEFQLGLQTAHTDSAKERATLGEQIKQLSEQSAKMTTETVNLTRALKGQAQTQGAWGEMVLATLLERSGLREGEEYVVQESHQADDGRRLRPDVIVNLPGGQRVVIDSKVSLGAFEAYVNAESDEERATLSQAHLASLRNHIKGLASKEYQAIPGGGLDYVIMFVPIEGALAVALQRDARLTSYAVENNVAIATPTTLMIALRTIENVWKVERRNRNADAIAERAGHLYNKFVGFLEDMRGLGNRLNQAQVSYQGAMGKLQNGSGNLVRQAEQLKELGAKTAKALPSSFSADGDELSEVGSGHAQSLPDISQDAA